MKKRNIAYAHEEAKIYQHYYRPSFNIFRLVKSVLSVMISGSSPVTHTPAHRRKK